MRNILAALLTLCIGGTAMAAEPTTQTAIFAGGCFWCMQPAYDATPGVVKTSVGYTGGSAETANYEAVSSGKTDHVEAIEVSYDPTKVTYERLIAIFFENIDPTDEGGQFADRGRQYQTGIFYADDAQKIAAEKAKATLAGKFAPQPIVVPILPAQPFYAAEDYHQRYYEKNRLHYNAYKQGSGRADYLKKTWGKTN